MAAPMFTLKGKGSLLGGDTEGDGVLPQEPLAGCTAYLYFNARGFLGVNDQMSSVEPVVVQFDSDGWLNGPGGVGLLAADPLLSLTEHPTWKLVVKGEFDGYERTFHSFEFLAGDPDEVIHLDAVAHITSTRQGSTLVGKQGPRSRLVQISSDPDTFRWQDEFGNLWGDSQQINFLAGTQSQIAVSVKEYGARGDGTTDDTAALQAAFDAVPSGATLIFPPGSYHTDGTLTSVGKTLNLEGYGATLFRTGTTGVLSIEGAFDTTISVSSLTGTTTTIDEATGILTTTLTLGSSPGWVRGDLVKIVADNEIPGVRPLDGTTLQRVGQHFFVYSCIGTTVILVGRVRDPFTTNIRAARMQKLTTRIDGLNIESANPFSGTEDYVRIAAMVRPRVNVTMGSFPSTGVSFKGCFMPQCDLIADCANDAPTSQKYGYAVNDGGSEFGIYNIVASNVRHAYTDGSSEIAAGETDLRKYGRPYGHVVSGTAYGTLDAAWSPHNSARGIIFRDTQSFNCAGAYALRGVECSVLGGVSADCGYGFLATDEDGKNGIIDKDSYNYGHYVDGLQILRPRRWAIDVKSNQDGPLNGVREVRSTTIRNVTVRDCAADEGFVVRSVNQSLVIDNLQIVSPATCTDHYVFRTLNSTLRMSNILLDYLAHTVGAATNHVYDASSTAPSTVTINGMAVELTTTAAALVTRAFQGYPGTHWETKNVEFSESIASIIGTTNSDATSRMQWLIRSTSSSDAYLALTGANIESTDFMNRLFVSRAPLIVARCATSSANRVLPKLRAGAFTGQELMVANVDTSGSNTVTINHNQTTYLTYNLGAANIVLTPLQYAKWMWNGTYWVQIQAATLMAR